MTQLEALKKIAARDGGLLRPQAVVDAARSVRSPLHKCFTWDDGEAARLYRLEQAQHLIRRFHVTTDVGGRPCKAPVFISLSVDRVAATGENPYRVADAVVSKRNLLEVAKRDALAQLKGVRDRYTYLESLSDVWDAIDAHDEAGEARHG